MPLLGLFSKKGRSASSSKPSSTTSKAAYSTSNISLNDDDDDYVSVTSRQARPSLLQAQSPASSSKLGLPFRRKGEQPTLRQQSYTDPLLDPPPRRSSLFQKFQDDPAALRSTQSLPDNQHHRPQPQPQQYNSSPLPTTTKKSLFSWSSNKERAKSVASDNQPAEDTSFNLKSFRHVRPNSPASTPSLAPAPVPPIPIPTPTTTIPSPSTSFQVTSRRPRSDSVSEFTLTSSASQQPSPSQQKMAAGAFRQAARRSATSLSLTDSPVLSPIRTSLDDRPPPSLLPSVQPRPGTPTRPPRQQPPRDALPAPSRPAGATKPQRGARTNAFAVSSSSSSSSEEEEEDSDSTSDARPGVSRKRTIRQNQPRANTLPPLSATVREQIQRSTPPAASSDLPSSSANGIPRAQSSLGVYGPGARPRASLSVGALTPSAKEARASIAVTANARLMNTPTPALRPLTRSPGSDTSESAPSGSDEDEDAPLSTLVPPRRPGTSLSSRSAPTTPRKPAEPLVDLNAPSTLTGRPIKAPPPMARDEGQGQKPRMSIDVNVRSRAVSQVTSPSSSKASQIPSPPSSRVSHAPPPPSSRTSQVSSPPNSKVSQASSSPGTRASQALPQSSGRLSQAASSSRPHMSLDTSSRLSSIPLSGTDRLSTVSSGGLRSNLSPPSVTPPTRPFARRESPASSTGDSSSGKAPLTPRDGSDYGGPARSAYSGPSPGRGRPGPGHGRKPSVTFEDERESPGKGKSRERDNVSPQEAKRRDRRRSEARAAIELGNVVNGPPPVDDEDVALGQRTGMQTSWTQPGMPMQIPMPPMQPAFGMTMGMPSPGGYGFPPPLPNADPAFFMAHQQAMAIAKQTFQYAVAQQALAAANDEWERSSTRTGFGGSQWGGYGMGMGGSPMFAPPAARSMYAGSVGGGGGGGWGGTGSVYGDAFGPAAAGLRQSTYSQVDLSAGAQRPARPRTKTAPSAPNPPGGRVPGPPSSFRSPGQ